MNEPNPYQPPHEPPSPRIDDWALIDLSQQEVEAFVGRKAGYYLKKWPLDRELAGTSTGFNWAAMFLSGMWLPYRKMYLATILFFGFILIESILEEVVFVGILGKPEPPTGLDRVVGLIASIICGVFGNRWYLSHTRRAVAEVRSQGLPEDAYLQALSRRGGTNLAASLGFFVAFLIAAFAAMFVLELLFAGG